MSQDSFEWPKALDSYRKWYDPNQPLADFFYHLGVALLRKGKMQDALCALTSSYQQTPKRRQLPFYLGMVYHQLGQWSEALAYYREALKYEPKAARIYNNIGTIFETMEAFPQALKSYRQALLHDQNHADAFYNIGNLMRKTGQFKEAVTFYRKALLLKPKMQEALINMAPLLRQIQDFDAAREAYAQLLQLDPKNKTAAHWCQVLAEHDDPSSVSATQEIVRLFDHYAASYDQHLCQELEYQALTQLARILDTAQINELESILDIGCGTGLAGQLLRSRCQYLEGWDLSAKMIEIASEKKLYDKLVQLDALSITNPQRKFELIVMLDVCPYIADLQTLLPCLQALLTSHSKIILTTENSVEIDCGQDPSGRFKHHLTDVQSLASKLGMGIVQQSTHPLRRQNEQWIEGGFFLLAKS